MPNSIHTNLELFGIISYNRTNFVFDYQLRITEMELDLWKNLKSYVTFF